MQNFLDSLNVKPENRPLLKTIYFVYFASGLMSIILGTLLPYIRSERNLSYAVSGLMLSAHQLGNLSAVLAAGFLPYLIGRKHSTLLMGSGSVIGLILLVVFKNPLPLIAAFVLTGFGRGTFSNICNVLVSDISGNKTGAITVLHALFATGALVSPVVVYAFTRFGDYGWKFAALTAAALTAAGLLLFGRSRLPDSAQGKAESGGSRQFFKDASFWINTMILFFYLSAEASIVGWFVIYFEDIGALPPAVAKLTPMLLWLMILLGRLACAALSLRVDKNKLLLALSVSFTLCYCGMLFAGGGWVCVVFLIGVGLSMSGIYPTTFSTMKHIDSTIVTGFVVAIASSGAILMPGIVGAVADSFGLAGGVATVLAALSAMTALVIVKLIKYKN